MSRLVLRLVLRELRGARARALSFVAALSVGVAAVVLVAGLGDSVARSIRLESRPMLGADVGAKANAPIAPEADAVLAAFPGVERTDTVDLTTMVAAPARADGAPGKSVMAELKAVGPGWPYYGAPELDPAGTLDALLAPDTVVVERAVLDRLGLAVGDTLRLGREGFTIRGVVLREPGRLPTGLVLGPRVFVSLDGLARAGLGDKGARVAYRALFRAPDEARAGELAARLGEALGPRVTIETWSDARPAFQRSLERTTQWLGLVALLALLVGGVGVAQATRAWMAQRLDTIAVQRTLGLTSGEVVAVAVLETAVLALVGSGVGAAVGSVALALTPALLDGLLPPEAVRVWQPAALLRGVGLGLGIALVFAADPLVQAARVPPLRVLRRDVEPVAPSWARRLGSAAALAAGVFALAWAQAGSATVGGLFVGALLVVVGVGAGGAAAVARGLGRAAGHVRGWGLRHGLAALGRPGSGLVPAVVSLGLGVVVVLTTVLVEGRLYAQIAQEFPETAPSAFLVDVQPDQREALAALLTEVGAARTTAAPMVVARLASVDGVSVDELARARPEGERWELTREQRISWRAELPEGNELVAGAPFSDAVAREVSVEERFAGAIGAQVGSHLTFDVQGVPIEMTVSSLRRVSWETFQINFFLMAEPGVLDGAPQNVLMTTQLPAERESAIQDRVAAEFPNVTLVSVRAALAQARGLLEKLGWGIRAVGAFTAVAGVAILASGVAADAARRGRQVALLKTLGVTRAGVMGLLALEYALVGLLAGGLGALGATGLSYGLVTQLLRLGWRTDGLAIGGAVLVSAGLCAVVGVLANQRALRVRPAEVLRGE